MTPSEYRKKKRVTLLAIYHISDRFSDPASININNCRWGSGVQKQNLIHKIHK
jgi:hypothetical protein